MARLDELFHYLKDTKGSDLHLGAGLEPRIRRHGHLEKVYENGLARRLRKSGESVFQQHPLQVRDEDGEVLGDFFADLFVNECLIVELKACKTLDDLTAAWDKIPKQQRVQFAAVKDKVKADLSNPLGDMIG